MLDPTSIWAEKQPGAWEDMGQIPYSIDSNTPPSYAEWVREDHIEPPTRLTVPDNQFVALLKENIGWHEAPDPIRQSDYWAEGMKVKPDARMWITSHIAIPYHETIDEQTFHIGKLIGYLKVPTHVGGQAPSVIRANIQEHQATTYGSIYEIPSVQSPAVPAFSAAGFENINVGYPYD